MTIRRILSLCMALIVALGCAGALAEEDLQAQLDAANARIAELEAQVEAYYPYYISQIVATYGEDGVIWLKDVQEQYEAAAAQYEAYGLSLASYGLEETVKRDILNTAVENAILYAKAVELGLDQFDEETEASIAEEAAATMEDYVQYYLDYFYSDAEEVTDEMRAEAEGYWQSVGVDESLIAEEIRRETAMDAAYEYAIRDVTVTEEDIQAAYEALVAQNQEFYTDDRTYNSDRNSGTDIAWNPEGYRAVKHVLIRFSDEQSQRYSELESQLASLNAERAAAEEPDEDAEEPARSVEEIDSDIAACGMEIEALYADLMPTAKEVVDAFHDGADFDDLIGQYNGDPGMENEPTASQGYAVAANSTTWEQVFTDGAMSIENVGEISDPVYGSNGIHIIYYMADIEPGEVGLEAIRDRVASDAEEQKLQAAYSAQLEAWTEEANVVYYYESFGLTAEE